MKKFFHLHSFIVGTCLGVTGMVLYLFLSGNLPWLQAVECPSEMIRVGNFCIDKYEASVWDSYTNDTSGTQYGTTSDNYPCGDNANACSENGSNPIYARSIAGVNPARYITWFQAAQACANSGKRLCTNQEWQIAVSGTPDEDTSDPGDDLEECNIWANSKPSGASWATENETIETGSASACVSDWGAYDMIGNVWEWTADWSGQGGDSDDHTNTATYNQDQTYNVNEAQYQGNGDGLPAAFLRGGRWGFGSGAGAFALFLSLAPSYSNYIIGFRCCQ